VHQQQEHVQMDIPDHQEVNAHVIYVQVYLEKMQGVVGHVLRHPYLVQQPIHGVQQKVVIVIVVTEMHPEILKDPVDFGVM
jgi:hypothetical protein